MSGKKAYLVINPRAGQNLTNIYGVLAVLWAAGWHTDVAIKEYGGHAIMLAMDAAEKGYDMILAYGGDGTLSQVINGVMNAKKQHCAVGLIPGGTANVWSNEIGIPIHPIKAALALVGSEARSVDIGHVEVISLTVPDKAQSTRSIPNERADVETKQYFLLMCGLGIDATVMSHVSKPLKYRFGTVAVGLSAAREVPALQSFPIEIRANNADGDEETLWRGEVMQVVIGNTRKYADVVEITPNAYIDDGVLEICLISAGDPLNKMQLLFSLLLRRRPDKAHTEYLHCSSFSLTVPASVDLQLDGSVVQLKDFLHKTAKQALKGENDHREVMVTYHFNTLKRALPVAIPRTYDNALFEYSSQPSPAEQENAQDKEQAKKQDKKLAVESPEDARAVSEQPDSLPDDGRKITLVGAVPLAGDENVIILAGALYKARTGETRSVAVRIDDTTIILNQAGRSIPLAALLKLHEGSTLTVEGKQNKHGAIRAKRVVI